MDGEAGPEPRLHRLALPGGKLARLDLHQAAAGVVAVANRRKPERPVPVRIGRDRSGQPPGAVVAIAGGERGGAGLRLSHGREADERQQEGERPGRKGRFNRN